MLWAVAGRYHFAEPDLWGMRMRRLGFWYRGHHQMSREEQAAMAESMRSAAGV